MDEKSVISMFSAQIEPNNNQGKEYFPALKSEAIPPNDRLNIFPEGESKVSSRLVIMDLSDPNYGMDRFGQMVDYRIPSQEEFKKALMNFPETRGPEIRYIGGVDPADPAAASGGKASMMMFDEAGILSRIRDLDQKRAGGVEPPALITAKEMADELESLPRSLVEVALDPQETGEADIFIEELKSQGESFAVAIDRREEFDWHLLDMAMSEADLGVRMKLPDPLPQVNWQDAAYKHFMSQAGVVVPDVPLYLGINDVP